MAFISSLSAPSSDEYLPLSWLRAISRAAFPDAPIRSATASGLPSADQGVKNPGGGVSELEGIGVDAGNGDGREGAEHGVVVAAQDGYVIGDCHAGLQCNIHDLVRPVVVAAADGDRLWQRLEPFQYSGPVGRTIGVVVVGPRQECRRCVDVGRKPRFVERLAERVPETVRIPGAGNPAEPEVPVSSREEEFGRHLPAGGLVDADLREMGVVGLAIDVYHGNPRRGRELVQTVAERPHDNAVALPQGLVRSRFLLECAKSPVFLLCGEFRHALDECAAERMRGDDFNADFEFLHGEESISWR